MRPLSEQCVLVLGLGESGLAVARWAARCGAALKAWDSRAQGPQAQALAQHLPQLTLQHQALSEEAAVTALLEGVTLVVKAPGLAPADPRVALLLERARGQGIPVCGELDLFVQALAEWRQERGYTPQVVAITGTNGKTTTTCMTGLLVERAGRRVAVAGNIGPTLLQTLSDALDAPPPEGEQEPQWPQVWVLELSSFQLHGCQGFEPDAAVVLNLTEDHLDWHGSMQAYAQDKALVYGERGVMVINADDPWVAAMQPAAAPVPAARGRARTAAPPPRRVIRFGLERPTRAGDFGLLVENGMAWLVRAQAPDDTPGATCAEEDLLMQRLMPADALRVRGRHNAANALAALALASAIDCPLAPMLHGLREYAGEPHRVQHVLTLEGVDFIDDSKGTNVGATVAAIAGLAMDRAPAKLVMILGGDGKGQDFAPLLPGVRDHARAVALLGRDAPALSRLLAPLGLPLQTLPSLEEATRWAAAQAQSGDAVVLSPACASLDMFRNYAHRAEVFVATVQALAAEQGGMQ